MSSTIEMRLNEPHEGFVLFMKELCEKRKVYLETNTAQLEYGVNIHKQDWYGWRRAILQFAKNELPFLEIEFDRDGDEEDERLRISWDGVDFTFQYWCDV